jgi:hypothetical protein
MTEIEALEILRKLVFDGYRLFECGEAWQTLNTPTQRLRAEIAALVNNYPTDSWKYDSDRVNSLLAALRQLSTV